MGAQERPEEAFAYAQGPKGVSTVSPRRPSGALSGSLSALGSPKSASQGILGCILDFGCGQGCYILGAGSYIRV